MIRLKNWSSYYLQNIKELVEHEQRSKNAKGKHNVRIKSDRRTTKDIILQNSLYIVENDFEPLGFKNHRTKKVQVRVEWVSDRSPLPVLWSVHLQWVVEGQVDQW